MNEFQLHQRLNQTQRIAERQKLLKRIWKLQQRKAAKRSNRSLAHKS